MAVLFALGAAALAQSATIDLAAHFKGLDGQCWKSSYNDGSSDTRCFHVAQGNQLAVNTHKLVNADGTVNQEGVLVVTLDPKSGVISDIYYNSGGTTFSGSEKRVGNEIWFYDPETTTVAAKWIISADGYQAIEANGNSQTYVKIGASAYKP